MCIQLHLRACVALIMSQWEECVHACATACVPERQIAKFNVVVAAIFAFRWIHIFSGKIFIRHFVVIVVAVVVVRYYISLIHQFSLLVVVALIATTIDRIALECSSNTFIINCGYREKWVPFMFAKWEQNCKRITQNRSWRKERAQCNPLNFMEFGDCLAPKRADQDEPKKLAIDWTEQRKYEKPWERSVTTSNVFVYKNLFCAVFWDARDVHADEAK